jgi:hypothetical protein
MPPLRTKCPFTLLAAFFILTSGCRKLGQSETSEAFNAAQAMKTLYGNYDERTQTSVASLPKDKSSLPARGEEQMTVRMLFSAFGGDASAQTFVLVTYAVPANGEGFDCHACAPIIGMATFVKTGRKWAIDASNRAITFSGEWGKPPKDIQLVQVGTSHLGIEIIDVGGGQGETTSVLDILVPWNKTVNLALERILGDDDAGLCQPKGLPCYSNHRTVVFTRNPNTEYYDLELRLTGTDLPASDNPRVWTARKVSGVEVLKFENGNYVQVSRSGDLTSVDRVVAEREGLK